MLGGNKLLLTLLYHENGKQVSVFKAGIRSQSVLSNNKVLENFIVGEFTSLDNPEIR